MTYRELLKLYQEGKLDKAQTDEVEHAIEKQEAISEYLYEKEEIPGLEVLQGQEKEEVFVQGCNRYRNCSHCFYVRFAEGKRNGRYL